MLDFFRSDSWNIQAIAHVYLGKLMMKPIVTAKIKDEAPYIIDWVAYHRALGFKDFVIVSNDCTDGSDELLAALERAGLVHHIDTTNIPLGDRSVGRRSTDALLAWDKLSSFSHLLSIDVDEFLAGSNCFETLMSLGSRHGAIFIPWIDFVSDYATDYSSDFIMERNLLFNRGGNGKLFVRINGLVDFLSSHKAIYSDNRSVLEVKLAEGCLAKSQAPYIAHYRTKSAAEFYLRGMRGYAIVKRQSDGRGKEKTRYRYNVNTFMELEAQRSGRMCPMDAVLKADFDQERRRLLGKHDVSEQYRTATVKHGERLRNSYEKFLPTYVRERIYCNPASSQKEWIHKWVYGTVGLPEHDAFLRLCTILEELGDEDSRHRVARDGLSIYKSKPLSDVLSGRGKRTVKFPRSGKRDRRLKPGGDQH